MSGDNEKRTPQSMERAFKMSAGKTERPARAAVPVAESAPPRARRNPMPVAESYDDDERASRRRAKTKRPFRKLKLIVFVLAAACLFGAGVLAGRSSTPVILDMDQLRNQLVTASAPISERIFHTGDQGVDFYDTLGQSGVDTQITDPRNYRPEYAQAPQGDPVATDTGAATDDPGPVTDEIPVEPIVGDAYEGKILEPQVKPKTEFPAYVALKASGGRLETGAATTTQPQQTQTQVQPTQTASGSQTLAPAQNKPQNMPQVQASGGGQTQTQPPAQTASADTAKGAFAVQVAAVRGEDEARALLNNLDQRGFKGWVEKPPWARACGFAYA